MFFWVRRGFLCNIGPRIIVRSSSTVILRRKGGGWGDGSVPAWRSELHLQEKFHSVELQYMISILNYNTSRSVRREVNMCVGN